MNIRKWYNKLSETDKKAIEKEVIINKSNGFATINGHNRICYILFKEYDKSMVLWIDDRMMSIADLIYRYVGNILFYKENNFSVAGHQYYRYKKIRSDK